MRQFPRERGFLPVSSPWGCPRRWFRVKQGGNALPALPQSRAFLGKNFIPIQVILTRLFFIFSKTNKQKRSTSPHSPKLEPEATTALRATEAPLPPPTPHKEVLSPLHIKWDLPPDPEPYACLSRGLSRPFAPPIAVTLYSPSSTKAQQNHHIQKQHLALGLVFFEQLQW